MKDNGPKSLPGSNRGGSLSRPLDFFFTNLFFRTFIFFIGSYIIMLRYAYFIGLIFVFIFFEV